MRWVTSALEKRHGQFYLYKRKLEIQEISLILQINTSYYESMMQARWHGLHRTNMNMYHITLENKLSQNDTLWYLQNKQIIRYVYLRPFLLHGIVKKSVVLWYRCTSKHGLTAIARWIWSQNLPKGTYFLWRIENAVNLCRQEKKI